MCLQACLGEMFIMSTQDAIFIRRICYQLIYLYAFRFQDLLKPDGLVYEPASCWKDVYQSMMNAQKMILITGWSVWEKLQLLRGEDQKIDSRCLFESVKSLNDIKM